MVSQKQNPLHLIIGAAILVLFLSFTSMNAFAATITKDTDASFNDVAIAQASSYVNVRSTASTSGKIVGKMAKNSAAIIKKTVNGEGGKWYQITSGSVTGYVKASLFKTGSAAAKIAKSVGTTSAKVTASSLRMRKQATTKSTSLGSLPKGTVLKVLQKNVKGSDGTTFMKVTATVNGKSQTGYVAQKYVKTCISLNTATAVNSSSSVSSKPSTSSSSTTSSTTSSKGSSIAATAKKYVGKLKYVYGGTSLKSGADCSGFVQAIYKAHGVTIPRTAASQAASGKKISKSQLQVGDLVFYSKNGKISHVAIYVGNGKIVHETTPSGGCKLSNMNYTTPAKYVTYLR